jgi:chromosome segregation ATPase
MQLDATTVALILTAIAALGGTMAQAVQGIMLSRGENARLKVDEKRAESEQLAQSASALQTVSSVSESLMNRYRQELEEAERERDDAKAKCVAITEENTLIRAQIKALLDMLQTQLGQFAEGQESCDICILKNAGFGRMIEDIRNVMGV